MSREANVAAQERFGATVNNGDLGALDELVAVDSADHDPAHGQVPGPQGFRTCSPRCAPRSLICTSRWST